MDKFFSIYEYSEQLFSDQKAARQAGEIMEGIMAASYKRIQRFLQDSNPQ
jgi:hypothetical protein